MGKRAGGQREEKGGIPPGVTGGDAWRALTELTGCAVAVFEALGKIRWVNEEAARVAGAPRERIMGRRIGDVLDAEVELSIAEWTRGLGEGRMSASRGHLFGGVPYRTTMMALGGGAGLYLSVSRREVEGITLEEWRRQASRGSGLVLGHLRELTPRELEVLAMLGEGRTGPEMASLLKRSIRTIENHCLTLHRKLGTGSRAELVKLAREAGLKAGLARGT